MPQSVYSKAEVDAAISAAVGNVYTKAQVDALIAKVGVPQPPVTDPPVIPPVTDPPVTGSGRDIDGGANYFAQFTNSLPTDPGFFPIGVWFEGVYSQSDIDKDKDAGLNLYVVLTRGSNLDLVKSNGMYALPQADEWAGVNSAAITGWTLGDEIDMQQGPNGGYTTMTNANKSLPKDGKLRYANYGKGVMFWESDAEAARFVNEFQHVTSVDTYWFTDANIPGGSEGGALLNNGKQLSTAQARRAANYGYTVDRLRALDAKDGVRRPIWNFVEVGWPMTETAAQGGRAIAAAEVRAAVWHSIIAGARGVIYFNHSFGGPNQSQHCLRESAYSSVRAAVKDTNATIKSLAAVLNSPFEDTFVTTPPAVRAMTKLKDGKRWIFAGSAENTASQPTFTLTGVISGTAVVVGENRQITISGGKFSDSFADGNTIHIYEIR